MQAVCRQAAHRPAEVGFKEVGEGGIRMMCCNVLAKKMDEMQRSTHIF